MAAPISDPEQEGWTRRSVADEPRLSEIVELYRSLGLEVLLVPYAAEGEGGCDACLTQTSPSPYMTVYTREPKAAPPSGSS